MTTKEKKNDLFFVSNSTLFRASRFSSYRILLLLNNLDSSSFFFFPHSSPPFFLRLNQLMLHTRKYSHAIIIMLEKKKRKKNRVYVRTAYDKNVVHHNITSCTLKGKELEENLNASVYILFLYMMLFFSRYYYSVLYF
jgi:hypothetical protein